ncbi:Matrixin [uncultured archaeon]|nr:Matrixin [uncultured archaeon]
MRFKLILGVLSLMTIVLLLLFYFMPTNKFNFSLEPGNSNFSITPNSEMQYYPNMRFADSQISYQISNCPLDKKNEMQSAFGIIGNLTSLKFNPVSSNGQISVTCEEKARIENEMFVAGEGGPVNITLSGNFYVITHGEILLLRKSDCPKPNVAIHELLHSLGFKHSENPKNIMYNITDCSQTIGDDTVNLINNLYSVPSYPDLSFENISGIVNGRFLDVNITVLNVGLNDAGASKIIIYADSNPIKEIDLDPIEMGRGIFFSMSHIFIPQISFTDLNLEIVSDFNEITKENNKIKLKIKS